MENNFCLPLLQRLKKIQNNQEQCRRVSNDLLSKLRSPSNNEFTFQPSEGQTVGEVSPNDDLMRSPLLENKERDEASEKESFSDRRVCVDRLSCKSLSDLQFASGNSKSIEKENVEPDLGGLLNGPKFPYLKKGQGLSRFKSKTLKGFKNPSGHCKISKAPGHQMPQMIDGHDEKQSNFEKLEQLINDDSFCSTSSKVLNLLQDDLSSTACSTPLSAKLSFIATPVYNKQNSLVTTEHRVQLLDRTSPVRKLFPTGSVSLTVRNQLLEGSDPNFNFRGRDLRGKPFCIGSKYSGILKTSEHNILTPPPSLLKVKFLEKGVKVLEYDNDDEPLNQTNCSEDTTDLISVSDLENLALLNFKVNLIHEDSLLDASNQQANYIANTASGKPKDSLRNCASRNLTRESQHEAASKDFILDSKMNPPDDETVDLKVHKMLLLSKVNDLEKEIDIFKNKNRVMEELILELKKEKQNPVINTNAPDLNERSKLNGNTKPKVKSTKSPHDKALDEVTGQLQQFSKKLCDMEGENNKLKRKILSLERREKELRRKHNENMSNKVGFDEDSGCPKFKRERLERKNSSLKYNTNGLKGPPPPFSLKQSNILKAKTVQFNLKEEKCVCKNGRSEIITENAEKEMQLSEENNNICNSNDLKEEADISTNNTNYNNNFAQEILIRNEKHLTVEERPLYEQQTKEHQEKQFHVIAKLNTKEHKTSLLLPIPEEESMESSFRKSCSISGKGLSNVIMDLTSDASSNPRFKEDKMETKPISVLKPFAVPDDSIEIVDVIGKNVTLSENEIEEIINVVPYPNGDKEIIYPLKKMYFYASNNSVLTTFSNDGREEIRFPNGQREIYYKDGSYEVQFPDRSCKSVSEDGTEHCVCSDGTEIRVYKSGLKTVHFPNGQKEVHENDYIRRIYPDGTTKTLFKDGTQETRYRNGKIRFKDAEGNVTMA